MLTLLSALGSLLSFRVRGRASLELELVALRHQLTVMHRQRPGRPRLGKSIPWPDDVWRRAGGQVFVPREQFLVHRPRHVGQDARPIHNGTLSCPRRRRHGPSGKWTGPPSEPLGEAAY